MAEAQEAAASLLDDSSEDDDDERLGIPNEEDLYPLEVAAKAALAHGSTAPQVMYIVVSLFSLQR